MTPHRVVLFVDYQNVYGSARSAFCGPGAPYWEGQIDPMGLVHLLVERASPQFPREVSEVRVYRGIPHSNDAKGYGAARRQHAAWDRSGITTVTRMLRYPAGWPNVVAGERPQEKGIDVALAVDFVLMAYRDEYDVGIIMSGDTDLKPALEAVAESTTKRVEVAAWKPDVGHARRLSISGSRLWCHWLDRADYERVADPTDYVRG